MAERCMYLPMPNGIRLLRADVSPSPVWRSETPSTLASSHALWAKDVETFEPWHEDPLGYVPHYNGGFSHPLYVVGSCASCLDVAWTLVRSADDDSVTTIPFPVWSAAMAVEQKSGRGQMRRVWMSPPGNVYISVRIEMPPTISADLSALALGAGILRSLKTLGIDGCLKWPNDILVQGKKVAGMLLEERSGVLMAGIGINLASCPQSDQLRKDKAVDAVSLYSTPVAAQSLGKQQIFGPLTFWCGLWPALHAFLTSDLARMNDNDVVHHVSSMLAWKGERVSVDGGAGGQGIVLGIGPDGGLVLGDNGETRVLHTGSIGPMS